MKELIAELRLRVSRVAGYDADTVLLCQVALRAAQTLESADIGAAETRLAKAIEDADRLHSHACLNQGTMAQVAAQERIAHFKEAFACVTGISVRAPEAFNHRLASALAKVA